MASAEEFLRAVEETPGLRIDVFVAYPGKALQRGALLGVEFLRDFDVDLDDQIPRAVALHIFHAAPFQPEFRAALGAVGDRDARLSGHGGHIHFSAQRRLHETDRHFAQKIIPVPAEDGVLLDRQDHMQVPGRAAAHAGGTVGRRTKADAGVHARRDPDPHTGGLIATSLAVAVAARLFDAFSRALTAGAGLLDAENAAGGDHPAAPGALWAAHNLGALFRAGAGAGFAGHRLGEANLLFHAVDRLFQAQFQVVAQVLAATRPVAILFAFAAEKLLEEITPAATASTESLAEYIEGIPGSAGAIRPGTRIEGGRTVLVKRRSFLGITQDAIRLAQFLELLLGLLVPRILVRMVFHRELAVRLFEFLVGGVFGNAQDLVKITLAGSHVRMELNADA